MTGGQRLADVDLPDRGDARQRHRQRAQPRGAGRAGPADPLPDGRVLHATRQRVVEDPARGRQSWIGTFADQPGSLVVLSKVRGVTTGFITYGAETFEIMPARGGRHMIYEVDPSKLRSRGLGAVARRYSGRMPAPRQATAPAGR